MNVHYYRYKNLSLYIMFNFLLFFLFIMFNIYLFSVKNKMWNISISLVKGKESNLHYIHVLFLVQGWAVVSKISSQPNPQDSVTKHHGIHLQVFYFHHFPYFNHHRYALIISLTDKCV